jgi:hypothetical protein
MDFGIEKDDCADADFSLYFFHRGFPSWGNYLIDSTKDQLSLRSCRLMRRTIRHRVTIRRMKTVETIVAGGGWQNPKEYRIKFKAVCCLVLAIPAAAASGEFSATVGPWIFALPPLLLFLSVVLFCIERPLMFLGFPGGDNDLRKLYSKRVGGKTDKDKADNACV